MTGNHMVRDEVTTVTSHLQVACCVGRCNHSQLVAPVCFQTRMFFTVALCLVSFTLALCTVLCLSPWPWVKAVLCPSPWPCVQAVLCLSPWLCVKTVLCSSSWPRFQTVLALLGVSFYPDTGNVAAYTTGVGVSSDGTVTKHLTIETDWWRRSPRHYLMSRIGQ